MISPTQEFKQYLRNRQNTINAEKSQESQSLSLFNETNFYRAFIQDALAAKKEVIIYSPFVTKFRTDFLKSTIEKLQERNIDVFIFTRPLEEYDTSYQPQIQCALKRYEDLGVHVFYPGRYIHEKVAIIDREILWEGSLNILSHRASNEMMRRISDESSANQVMTYLGLNKKLAEAYKLMYEKLYSGLVAKTRLNFKAKIKIFLLGLAIPVTAWLIVNIMSLKPLQITELVMSLVRFLQARS